MKAFFSNLKTDICGKIEMIPSLQNALWLLPALWLANSFLSSLLLGCLLVVTLVAFSAFRMLEKRLKKFMILSYEFFIATLLASCATFVAEAFIPSLVENGSYLVGLSVFAGGLLPMRKEAPEEETFMTQWTKTAEQAFLLLVSYSIFGLIREMLAYGTLFEGTSFSVSFVQLCSYSPLTFLGTPAGGLLIFAFLSALVLCFYTALKKTREKAKENNGEKEAEEHE